MFKKIVKYLNLRNPKLRLHLPSNFSHITRWLDWLIQFIKRKKIFFFNRNRKCFNQVVGNNKLIGFYYDYYVLCLGIVSKKAVQLIKSNTPYIIKPDNYIFEYFIRHVNKYLIVLSWYSIFIKNCTFTYQMYQFLLLLQTIGHFFMNHFTNGLRKLYSLALNTSIYVFFHCVLNVITNTILMVTTR